MEIEPGILLVDKPQGITSFDVIRILRKDMNIKKMGHAGTLDPMATGLLIVAYNSATTKLTKFLKLNKKYEAEITFGLKTDTLDMEGQILEKIDVDINLEEQQFMKAKIVETLNSMVGVLNIEVPAYSAIKKDGKALYELARKGMEFTPPKRDMEVLSIQMIDFYWPKIKVLFHVSSGTYIRSLVQELASRLQTIATLSALRRISIGNFVVDGALKLTNTLNK